MYPIFMLSAAKAGLPTATAAAIATARLPSMSFSLITFPPISQSTLSVPILLFAAL
jgi:hypothetical protein